MAYTAIDDPSAYFQIALWTGNGGTLAVTNDGNSDLQPDLLWLKSRSGATTEHHLVDTTRGEGTGSDDTPNVDTHSNSAEYDRDILSATGITSDGFSLDGYSDTNANTATHVGWQWKANGGSTTTNDASATGVGSVDSVDQANTTSGFSIVTYTGTGSGDITLAHGLGKVPNLIIGKVRNQNYDWRVYHSSEGASKALQLNSTVGAGANNAWGGTTPTSTVFTAGRGSDENMNYGSGDTIVAYCWAEVQGYSKFGSYTGNGDADGPFVYTGFKIAYIMIKRTDGSDSWVIYDNARSPYNMTQANLLADSTGVEYDNSSVGRDFVSNGMKVRSTGQNASGGTYIYMAFAEQPFVTSGGVPCTAR